MAEPPRTLAREMGFTLAEFMRILPSALHGYSFSVDGRRIAVEMDGGTLAIRLGSEQLRRIAMLALPYIPVEFDYSEISEADFRRFLAQFDLYYRKGGG